MSFDFDALAAVVRKVDVAQQGPAAAPRFDRETFLALGKAAERFEARTDSFAQGKAEICRDLAAKLDRYGSFASDKQADFARKLIEWSLPRAAKNDAFPQPALTPRPNTWAAIQSFSRVTIGRVKFAKKNAEPLWWILFGDDHACVGKITAEGATGFARKIRDAGLDAAEIKAALDEIERDPKAAIAAHGIATGSCGCCGRELTDPESIAVGIGPICIEKLGGGF